MLAKGASPQWIPRRWHHSQWREDARANHGTYFVAVVYPLAYCNQGPKAESASHLGCCGTFLVVCSADERHYQTNYSQDAVFGCFG
jgi:hypothetical protein